MIVKKALITAAGRHQRDLPHQRLLDRDCVEKSVLEILIAEVVSAGLDTVGVVITPGDERHYERALQRAAGRVHLIPQVEPRGYGHAVYCARAFLGAEPCLHLVGDHLYVSPPDRNCARELVEVAQTEACTVSAVQATRESGLPNYGVVGGRRLPGRDRAQHEVVGRVPFGADVQVLAEARKPLTDDKARQVLFGNIQHEKR